MKKSYGFSVIISVILLCFAMSGSAAAENLSYESVDFEQTMLVGESEKFLSFKYWTSYTNSEYMWDVIYAESSDPSVVEATYDDWVYITAKSAGTAVITLKNEEDTLSFPITVLGEEQFGIRGFSDMTMKIGDETQIGDIEYFIGDTVGTAAASEYFVTSSDESVVDIYDFNKTHSLTVKKAGEATVEIYLKERNKVAATFKITVPKEAAAQKPKAVTQVSLSKSTLSGGDISSDSINIGVALTDEYMEYEIYMSDKKKKGYKKVGWVDVSGFLHASLSHDGPAFDSVNTSDGDSMIHHKADVPACVTVKKFKKKKLKPNKKYYVKVRARYTDKNHSDEWSPFSDVRKYWTAPAKIPKKKIKYNSKTGKLSFPKVKNVAGYEYGMSSFEFIGYNVFGGKVYYSENRTTYTTKNSLTAKKISGNDFAEKINFVSPYAKHNGYYYMDGYEPFKKLKKLESYDGHRYAGKY